MAKKPETTSILAMRRLRGLSQQAAADLMGIDRATLSHLENGHFSPSFSVFRSMRETYGVTVDALFAAFVTQLNGKLKERRKSA